ncbi:MAG: SH3 domain-containing protein [Verrucomicrobiales bacterium]|nr:SH3 domain-containing protein [Verrucomicrobiales bacterium]
MAVVQRNSEAVMAMLDPEVHLSFGGDMGRDAFIEMWRPSDKESELWRELEEIIYLGGAFDSEEGTSFAAPSLFADFGSDPNDDAFTQLLIKGRNVRLRAEPSLDASIIATASWEIVERVSDWQNEQWVQVLRSDGTKGWVAAEFLRSPIDYRIIFSKGPTGWKIAAFIAGD